MKDLLRSLNIPAAVVLGFYGDMKNVPAYDYNRADLGGHAWCFAYVNGQWKLYDMLKGVYGETDKKVISQHFYNGAVDGVAMNFDGMDLFRIDICDRISAGRDKNKHYSTRRKRRILSWTLQR